MDRQRWTATRVTNYRKFHLSGDLDQVVQGKVSGAVELLETTMSCTPVKEDAILEELQEQIKEQKEHSAKLQQQVENMKLCQELEAEQLQHEQWELAIQELRQSRELMLQQHESNKEKIRNMAQGHTQRQPNQAVAWMQSQVQGPRGQEDADRVSQKQKLLDQLHKQEEEIQRQIEDLSTDDTDTDTREPLRRPMDTTPRDKSEQEILLEQIRTTLAPKEADRDLNKALLKALITTQNKTAGCGGTSTLKPDMLSKLSGEAEFSTAEWLASLNRQEEGESEVSKILNKLDDDSDCRAECRHTIKKSGMLDKSTTNIGHKEVWPQKNLGEDWAEEEMEFKQLKFEHLVAGETRTIKTCTDPAQILGRLRLLRRIAYLKLRGIEWPSIRKMYAAILSSIETREYSWESNFNRFESILYRRVLMDRNNDREHREPR